MSGEGESFTCAMCHGTFNKGRPDEEALTEMESHFGEVPPAARAIVCNDCFTKLDPAAYPDEVRETIRKLKGDA